MTEPTDRHSRPLSPIENLLLQSFASGLPLTRHDVARWLHTGEIGRRKITAEFCFPVLNQMHRGGLLTRTSDGWYQLTEKGRLICAQSIQDANNGIPATSPAGSVTREN